MLLVLLEIVEAGALDPARDSKEAQINHIIRQTDRLKQLGAPVGGDGRDAHLGENLQQTFVDALAIVVLGVNRIHQQFAGTDQVVQNLVGEVRIDRRRTEPKEHGEMVGIPGPAGLHDYIGITTQTLLDQVVVNRTGCHKGVYRQLPFLQVLVGENQQHIAIADCLLRFLANLADGLLQPLLGAIAHGDTSHLKTGAFVVGDLEELGGRQHGRGQDDAVSVIGGLLEHIALGTQTGLQGHDNRLTQRVDCRVGHLGELLAEVIRHVADLA